MMIRICMSSSPTPSIKEKIRLAILEKTKLFKRKFVEVVGILAKCLISYIS